MRSGKKNKTVILDDNGQLIAQCHSTEFRSAEENAGFLLARYEKVSDRCKEAEKFLLELANMPLWKRFILGRKVNKFLSDQMDKYDF